MTDQERRKPTVIVIENPGEDPGYQVFGDVEVSTMTSYPFSKYCTDPNETAQYTEDCLAMLRDQSQPEEFRTWLRGWLEAELDTRDRDFEVDWDTLTIAQPAQCRHCGRSIFSVEGRWIDPEATGDDAVWRETCDANDETRAAEHEPEDPLVEQVPADVRAALTLDVGPGKRRCLWLDETSNRDGRGFVPSIVVENEAGHSPLAPNTPLGPVLLGPTYSDAVQIIDAVNASVDISHTDMLDIVMSSMAASRRT